MNLPIFLDKYIKLLFQPTNCLISMYCWYCVWKITLHKSSKPKNHGKCFWTFLVSSIPAVPAVPGSLGLAETSIHLVQQLADLHETRRLDRWTFSRWFFKAQFGKLMINQLLEKMGQLDVKYWSSTWKNQLLMSTLANDNIDPENRQP